MARTAAPQQPKAPTAAALKAAAKAKEEEAPPAAAPEAPAAAAPEAAPEAAPAAAPENLSQALGELKKRVAALKAEAASLVSLVSLVDKKAAQALKKRTGANKGSASVTLSEKLAAFLGAPADTVMTRSEVCAKVGDYTKEKGCRPDGKRVVLDAALADLIGGAADEEIPFIALVARLRSHMTPLPAPAAAAPDAQPADSGAESA
jgi:chromatin remodeling complex protein RSC6